jgi:hypothetical protein
MKILSYQSFSLYSNGGGSRILRRLFKGRENSVYSLTIEQGYYKQAPAGPIEEKIIPAIPLRRPWMKWKSRDVATWIRENPLKQFTINKIRREANAIPCDVIHIMSCGPWSTALCDDPVLSKKPLWISVHDHYATTQCPFKDAQRLWNLADRRLMISPELGKEYQKLFGYKEFELITDGVLAGENSPPAETKKPPHVIYFAGLLHIEYLDLFKTMADTLDVLTKQGYSFKVVLRGTQRLNFMKDRDFEIEYRPVVLDDQELKKDLDAASILYLPIKFVTPDFYLYSLSTKMVGYLGASGSMLYHGPGDSAACHLLQQSAAAVCCTSINTDDLAKSILSLVEGTTNVSANAKKLAQNQFNLKLIQDRFWQIDGQSNMVKSKNAHGVLM